MLDLDKVDENLKGLRKRPVSHVNRSEEGTNSIS